jgi:Subtilase family
VLEPRFPLELQVITRVVHDLVEHRGFRCSSPVVLEFLLCLLPRLAPEHAGWFGEMRLTGVSVGGRSAERGSGGGSEVGTIPTHTSKAPLISLSQAIIDSGVDIDHPDLSGNIWNNEGEVPDNGVDDDGNGYIDDYNGYDFAGNDGDVTDESGHGTHVAGIVAATGNNALGVIGVAWRANFVPVKCLNGLGEGTIFDLVESLDYVSTLKDQGVPITAVTSPLGRIKSQTRFAVQSKEQCRVMFS